MTQHTGQVDYDRNEELRYGELYDENNKPTEIMLIPFDKDYKKTNGYSVENKVIAQKIKHMLENGEEVKDHGSLRPCRAGDFCILVQKNDELRAISKFDIRFCLLGDPGHCRTGRYFLKCRIVDFFSKITIKCTTENF